MSDQQGPGPVPGQTQPTQQFPPAGQAPVPPPKEGLTKQQKTWIMVGAGALIVIVVLVLLFSGGKKTVPNVVGMTGADATRALQAAGLTLGETSTLATDAVAGTVIEQVPLPGEKVKSGTAVSIVVAVGPEGTAVPNVLGMPAEQATATLSAAGFVPVVTESYSTTAAAGIVISQVPAAGTKAAANTQVAITVSLGKQSTGIKVPDVVGMTQADAEKAIEDVGLSVSVYTGSSSSTPKGKVDSQLPDAGTVVSKGTAIGILVSTGAPVSNNVSVPNVIGKSEADAKSAIQAAGLVPSSYKGSSATVPAGSVIGQVPDPGTSAPKGSTVGFMVSTGPASGGSTVSVPNVVGKTEADAKSALTAAGLTTKTYKGYSDTVAKGKVIEQIPVAGATVAPGTQIGILVSLGKAVTEVAVPDVVGMTKDAATQAITDAGLKPYAVTEPSDTVAEGKVVEQVPTAGTKVAPGSTVIFGVSSGPPVAINPL